MKNLSVNNLKEKMSRFVNYMKLCVDEDAWLVYQMGKVGSTSIESIIGKSLHFHTLYSNYQFRYAVLGFCSVGVLKYIRQLMGRFLINFRKEVKIISIIRDPARRDVSMFFQDLPYYICRYNSLYSVDTREDDDEYLMDVFIRTFDFEYQEGWFDFEIKRFAGIDVFCDGYSRVGDIKVYKKGKYCLYLLRDVDIVRVTEILGVTGKVERRNVGVCKWYGPVYQSIANDLMLIASNRSSSRIRRLYNSW